MATYKIDAMDLDKRHVPVLEETLRLLKEELAMGGHGISVPIRARKRTTAQGETFHDEWEPSDTWDTEQKVNNGN